MAVKKEADEEERLDSVPFGRRLEMASLSRSSVGEQADGDYHCLQEGKIKALQVFVAQLEEQLAYSNKLAAERLAAIEQLELSLNTVSQERDLFRGESLKRKQEIDYLLCKDLILEKQVSGNLGLDAPDFQMESVVAHASELSHSNGSHSSESEQIKRQVVVNWSTGLPFRSDNCAEANGSFEHNVDKNHNSLTTTRENFVHLEEMQSANALKTDESVLATAMVPQSAPLLNSNSYELPIPSLNGSKVKEEVFSTNGLVKQNHYGAKQGLGNYREIGSSSAKSVALSEIPSRSALSEGFNKANKDKIRNTESESLQIIPSINPLQMKVENVCEDDESIFGNFLAESIAVNNIKEIVEDGADKLDHLSLTERMKVLVGRSIAMQECEFVGGQKPTACVPDSGILRNMLIEDTGKALKRDKQENGIANFIRSESIKIPQIAVTHRRRKKRTVTDNLETALEEDAPGLLQVLVAKGVTLEQVKLYGSSEDVEPIEISEDGFDDLETVISKLFTQSSFLKFAPLRQAKGAKENYCLACLVSLIEQAQYSQFRKWPVEWGWCRDLHSFIFVFQNHNRIVLERPEYGFATYFFEIVGSFPIDWQIRRLVTTMKLASFSRVSLIENKPLRVGDDLTVIDAKILEEYGWIPNTGLGTMLNYHDRVVHDVKNENISEWRSKIGRLLREGYDGGSISVANPPKRVVQYKGFRKSQIQLDI